MTPQVEALDHLVLTVADPEASIDFYTRILGMRAERFVATDGSTRMALVFGRQKINLHRAGAEFAPHAAAPRPGSADLCFLSRVPPEAWLAHLAAEDVASVEGPVRRTGATGPILSIYCRDPDGNLIEIATPVEGAPA